MLTGRWWGTGGSLAQAEDMAAQNAVLVAELRAALARANTEIKEVCGGGRPVVPAVLTLIWCVKMAPWLQGELRAMEKKCAALTSERDALKVGGLPGERTIILSHYWSAAAGTKRRAGAPNRHAHGRCLGGR